MAIRKYQPSDYDAICEISKHIWGGTDYLPMTINKYYEDPHSIPIVLETDGEIVSVANTRMITPDIGWLEAMRTHPKARGNGYSTLLTKEQMNNALEMGATYAELLTNVENIATRKLLDRLSFDEIHLYYIWGWKRQFEEYEDPVKNEIDREGNLISIKHIDKHASEQAKALMKDFSPINSIEELKHLTSKINQMGFDSNVIGDYQVLSLNAYLVDDWLKEGKLYKIDNPPSVISIQKSKESKPNFYSISIGVTSVDPIILEVVTLYVKQNFEFDSIELMFSEQLKHKLFSIEAFRFRHMRKKLNI